MKDFSKLLRSPPTFYTSAFPLTNNSISSCSPFLTFCPVVGTSPPPVDRGEVHQTGAITIVTAVSQFCARGTQLGQTVLLYGQPSGNQQAGMVMCCLGKEVVPGVVIGGWQSTDDIPDDRLRDTNYHPWMQPRLNRFGEERLDRN
jgi:hypothetical protein